mmetsp:Transcript_2266/g.6756  ORF Transcript_2266/g.6756 Transcript_2266/m.6756 type:complete len:213 (+) Transcript_2266:1486-2124(+)
MVRCNVALSISQTNRTSLSNSPSSTSDASTSATSAASVSTSAAMPSLRAHECLETSMHRQASVPRRASHTPSTGTDGWPGKQVTTGRGAARSQESKQAPVTDTIATLPSTPIEATHCDQCASASGGDGSSATAGPACGDTHASGSPVDATNARTRQSAPPDTTTRSHPLSCSRLEAAKHCTRPSCARATDMIGAVAPAPQPGRAYTSRRPLS